MTWNGVKHPWNSERDLASLPHASNNKDYSSVVVYKNVVFQCVCVYRRIACIQQSTVPATAANVRLTRNSSQTIQALFASQPWTPLSPKQSAGKKSTCGSVLESPFHNHKQTMLACHNGFSEIARIVKWLLWNTRKGPLVLAGRWIKGFKVQPNRLLNNTQHRAILSPDPEYIPERPQTLTDVSHVRHNTTKAALKQQTASHQYPGWLTITQLRPEVTPCVLPLLWWNSAELKSETWRMVWCQS